MEIVGGQSIQAKVLWDLLGRDPSVRIDFLPINPRLPKFIRPLQRIKYLRTIVTSGSFLCRLIWIAHGYDILHSFSASNYSFLLSAAPVMMIGRLYGKKTIVNYRDGRAEQHLAHWRSSRLLRLTDRIVTPSEFLVDVFAKFGYRAQPIFNGIDPSRYRYRERGQLRPIFLHNRGLEPLYNVPCTLKAFRIIQARYPEAALTIAHDGPLRSQLEQMVKDWGLRNVSFVGIVPRDRIAESYDAADIYLTSPNIDNMPGSLLECYASGLPVVATRAGGIPYMARDGETALLVEVDDHEAMAQAAIRLIEEDGLALRISVAARKDCERYSLPKIRQAWLELYRELAQAYLLA
jgi:glycosyltransferase involved in cell wall biosynthesis